MRIITLAILFFHQLLSAGIGFQDLAVGDVVVATKRIQFDDFPSAFNPSIIKVEQGYLMVFRHIPDFESNLWVSDIVMVLLDEMFEPKTEPEILKTRLKISKTPSQSEDPRLFSYRGRIFLIYNDNIDEIISSLGRRRDMFIAELLCENGQYRLSVPLKLVYEAEYYREYCQKNWMPFERDGTLMFIYSINPHRILYPNLFSGACYHCYETSPILDWNFGKLRGSTPPQLVDDEYLVFFHSGTVASSPASSGWELWHYFMGAYTFSSTPPFRMTKMTTSPLIGEGFYTPTYREKRVIFPGGFVVSDSYIHVAYGKDDCEMWIATLDKAALKRALVSVND